MKSGPYGLAIRQNKKEMSTPTKSVDSLANRIGKKIDVLFEKCPFLHGSEKEKHEITNVKANVEMLYLKLKENDDKELLSLIEKQIDRLVRKQRRQNFKLFLFELVHLFDLLYKIVE